MRKYIKIINKNDKKYLFDGACFAIFEIYDDEECMQYIQGEDDNFKEIQETNKLNKVVINVSNACNLHCRYCYAEGGNYGRANAMMSKETFDNILMDLKKRGITEINVFSFFGGEPTLNFSLLKYALPTLKKSFLTNNIEIVTNGCFLTKEMVEFFKDYNVMLSISYDGPEEITDKLRGVGVYKHVQESMNLCKKLNYSKLCVSATYTRLHEINGYSYGDLCDYLEQENVRVTVSSVITNDKSLKPQNGISKDEMRDDIRRTLNNILNKKQASVVNPYVYAFLLSILCNAKTTSYCDDLLFERSITYDYNGDKYSCFRFWNDSNHSVNNEVKNHEIAKANDKNQNHQCVTCWARNMCKVCVAAVMQDVSSMPMKDNRCVDQETFEIVLDEIINILQENRQEELASNFLETFLVYE